MSSEDAASILQWWDDAGVDCLVDEIPRDWLRAQPSPVPKTAPSLRDPAPALPDQLDLFHRHLAESDGLPFAAPAAPRLCPSGNPASGLMILTDMPSHEDCEANSLLSGKAGTLFDNMLAAIGRDRDSVYLAALSCLRSPSGSFDPASAQKCAMLARHHISLVAPNALLLLGDNCARALLGAGVIDGRARWHEMATDAGPIAAIATFHPNYLLEQQSAKRHAWADLSMLMERLDR
jgi:DNA polymerase